MNKEVYVVVYIFSLSRFEMTNAIKDVSIQEVGEVVNNNNSNDDAVVIIINKFKLSFLREKMNNDSQ